MAGPDDLYDLCRELLEACDRALTESPAGRIDRRYVSHSAPALDVCELLTVHCVSPAEADTSPLTPSLAPALRATVFGSVYLVALAATIVRCVPVFDGDSGNPPSAEAYDAAARATLGDIWSVWNHVRDEYRAKTLFATRTFVHFDPPVPIGSLGGAAGWVMNVRVNLDGFDPS